MNFVKSLAKQLGPRGIRVNGVAPGPIWTPLQISGGASEGKVVTFGATSPLGRAGTTGRAGRHLRPVSRRRRQLHDGQHLWRGRRPRPALASQHWRWTRESRKIEMLKTRVWGAFVLAVIVGGHGARAQTPVPPSPKDFVMAASQSNQYEILAARVASVQSQDPRVRTFAKTMIQDHIRLSQDLRNAAVASGLPAPDSGMSSDQAMLLSGLQGRSGPGFRQDLRASTGTGARASRRSRGELCHGGIGSEPSKGGAIRSAFYPGTLKNGAAVTRRCRRILSPRDRWACRSASLNHRELVLASLPS